MGEPVALGTQELCHHHAQCSFHIKAGATLVAVLGLVWVRVDRHWLLNEVVGNMPAFLRKKPPSAPSLPPIGIFHEKIEVWLSSFGSTTGYNLMG